MPSRFNAIAVQYRCDLARYASVEALSASLDGLLVQAVRASDQSLPTLVVLPELIGLGLCLTPNHAVARGSADLRAAAARLAARVWWRVAGTMVGSRVGPTTALLAVLSRRFVEATYSRVFADLARRHAVTLVAGSAPIAPTTGRAIVHNAAYVFGPDGALLGVQRKVALTPAETRGGLCLNPGRLDELAVIRLPFCTLGVAICLDGFQPSVLDAFEGQGADVIAQPSFNAHVWDAWQEADWAAGLWAACQHRPGIRAGINPMMVGSLLDVVGEGRSSIVAHADRTPDGDGYLARAQSPTEETVLTSIV